MKHRIALALIAMWAVFAVGLAMPRYVRCMDREGWWNPLSKVRCELEGLGLRHPPRAR